MKQVDCPAWFGVDGMGELLMIEERLAFINIVKYLISIVASGKPFPNEEDDQFIEDLFNFINVH